MKKKKIILIIIFILLFILIAYIVWATMGLKSDKNQEPTSPTNNITDTEEDKVEEEQPEELTEDTYVPAPTTGTIKPYVNNPPFARNDLLATNEDTVLLIYESDLFSNDVDYEGNTITIVSNTDATYGTVIRNADSYTYIPNENFNGPDSFSYTISDGTNTASATVAINVVAVNDYPLATNDVSSTDEDVPLVIVKADLLSNDSDIDGDSLSIKTFGQPSHGALTDNGDTITYTPDGNYNGTDSFSYELTDGIDIATAYVNLTINAINDAPVAEDDSINPNDHIVLTITKAKLLLNDSDVDGDTLSIKSFGQPDHGSLIDNGDTFTYTPDIGYNETDSFTYELSDGVNTASATVTITIVAVPD